MLYSSNFWNSYYTDGEKYGLPNTTYDYNESTHKYNNQKNEGMLIDLTTSRIIFGSGNFRVDPDGSLTSTAGYIANWKIEQNKLSSNNGAVYLCW